MSIMLKESKAGKNKAHDKVMEIKRSHFSWSLRRVRICTVHSYEKPLEDVLVSLNATDKTTDTQKGIF